MRFHSFTYKWPKVTRKSAPEVLDLLPVAFIKNVAGGLNPGWII